MELKTKNKIILKGIGIFFGTFLLYHIILSPFFPTTENNILLAPDWYDDVGMIISLLSAVIFVNYHRFIKRSSQENSNACTTPHINPEQREVASDMPQNNLNWDNLGQSIQSAVDRAINSKDYQKLSETIRQTVSQAADAGNEAIRQAAASFQAVHPNSKLYCRTFGKRLVGFLKIFGGGFLALFGFLAVWGAWMAGGFVTDPEAAGFCLAILGVGIWLICNGFKTRTMVKHFKIYQQVLGEKTYCPVKTLASSVGKTEAFVRKELLTMIQKGFFLEGHLDKEKENLITSHETFSYYEQSRMRFEAQQQKAATKHETPKPHNSQIQEVLDQGNAFISQIRKSNDDIPGQEISEKISHIELLVQKIFQRAEAHPEIVPDLKKLMDYYLPMTVKLLTAYAEMDAQPIQGETIIASKREIEATLETLTLAFEKLLDDLFLDTAMDVSSDISVLNALLAQEGLTEDGFSKLKE